MAEQGSTQSIAAPTRLDRAFSYARMVEQASAIDPRLDLSADAIIITGIDLERPGPTITYVNAAFQSMSGYQRDELVGTDPRIMQGYDSDHAELSRMKACLLQGEPFEGSVINYRKTGEEYVVGWAIAPVRDSNGAIRRWLSLQSDVLRDGRAARTHSSGSRPTTLPAGE